MEIVINTILLFIMAYIIWLFITILFIPEDHYNDYRKFRGSGTAMIMKNGKLVIRKYKTQNDTIRFLNNIKN